MTEKAMASPRLRMNHNFHDSLDAPAQRLLNALEPGTMLPVHRHRHTSETYIVLRGSILVVFCDDKRTPTGEYVVSPEEGIYGIHIPAGQWHTLVVRKEGTVIFEVKDGPYAPLKEEDILIPVPDKP